MAVPTVATYSVAAKVHANTGFRDLIDAGVTGGSLKIRDADDVLLALIPLPKPCGTVAGDTGVLTLDVTAAEDNSADVSGIAAYGEFCALDGTVHLALPTQAGTAPVAGKLVLNTLNIIATVPVTLLSATIG